MEVLTKKRDMTEFGGYIFFVYKPDSLNIDLGHLLENKKLPHSYVHFEDINNELNSKNDSIVLLEKKYFSKIETEIIRAVCEKQKHKLVELNNFEQESFLELLGLYLKQFQYEEKIQSLEDEIVSNERLVNLGELTGSVIHDLNNYANVCLASFSGINYIVKSKGNLDAVERFSKIGERSVKELGKLSSKCDSFIKGEGVVQEEVFHLYEICEWLEGMFRGKFRENRINFNIDVNKSVIAKTDKSILMQSLLNLIKNSIKALEDASLDKKWITISFKHTSKAPTVSVTDAGSIPSDMKPKLFEKYFTSDCRRGHGLGLFMVKKRLAEIDVAIEIDKSVNTCFNLFLKPSAVTYGKLDS